MAGTAAEQATGLSKPVIQIEGEGPQFTKSFAEAQRRLLGNYIFCATNYKNQKQKIDETIKLIIKIIYFLQLDKRFLVAYEKESRVRIGRKGASLMIVNDIATSICNE